MRILITHELFMPDFAGGGEKIVFEYAKRLKERGYDITVLTTGNPKIKDYEGIKTVRLPIPRYLFNFAFLWIAKYAKDFDIIQTNNYNACLPSFLAAKLTGKPVVCMVHGVYGNLWTKMRGKLFGAVSKFAEKIQLNRDYDKLVFYSDFALKQAIEIGIPKEKTTVNYLGINHKNYYPGKKEKYVLFVGRLAKQKGLEILLDAAKELPDIKFKIVGKGELERLKKTAANNVEFLGFRTGKELYELYAHASIFCLPSLAETFGLVILEAMASGCAIVSTVDLPYKGFKVEYGDKEGLKKAIKYLIDNPKLAEKMGKENIKTAKKFTWNKFVDNLEKIYKELLAS